jgi:hypothetical protein
MMHTADTFEMIETITREALARHPVWAHFEQEEDRDVILGWGVRETTVDDEIARYEFCGPQPLFPVLQLDPLPPRPHLIVSVTFESACGASLPGYLLEPHAFGVFAGDREFCFNRNLASIAARAADGLASDLGRDPERLFPLAYASDLRTHTGCAIRGEIAAFW